MPPPAVRYPSVASRVVGRRRLEGSHSEALVDRMWQSTNHTPTAALPTPVQPGHPRTPPRRGSVSGSTNPVERRPDRCSYARSKWTGHVAESEPHMCSSGTDYGRPPGPVASPSSLLIVDRAARRDAGRVAMRSHVRIPVPQPVSHGFSHAAGYREDGNRANAHLRRTRRQGRADRLSPQGPTAPCRSAGYHARLEPPFRWWVSHRSVQH
jgi:hypothetical protein